MNHAFTYFHFELYIHLGVEAITDLYVTVPEDVAAVPQKYTVHCLINEECDCADENSSIDFHTFMEGSLDEPAVHFCDEEPSLSCSQGSNSAAMPCPLLIIS